MPLRCPTNETAYAILNELELIVSHLDNAARQPPAPAPPHPYDVSLYPHSYLWAKTRQDFDVSVQCM